MDSSVHLLVLIKGWTEAGHQIAQTPEGQQLFQKVMASRDQSGCKVVVNCDSRWSSQQWANFAVEVYPNLTALQEHMKRLTDLNWWRYIDITTVLGTSNEGGM